MNHQIFEQTKYFGQKIVNSPLLIIYKSKIDLPKIKVEWNETQGKLSQDLYIHQLFEKQVEQTPEAIAVVFGEQQITYQELNCRANQLAHYLQELGVKPEMPVGLYTERSLEMIVGLLGILKAGGVYLPLDPAYPQERINFMLADSQTTVLITQKSLVSNLPTHNFFVVSLDEDWPKIATKSENNFYASISGKHLAYIIYTSGSTGTPKGVLIEHQGIAVHCSTIIEHYQLSSKDRVFQLASMSFDVSLEQILPTLGVGATLILSDLKFLTGLDFHQKLLELDISVVNLPPAYWTQWLQSIDENGITTPLNHLRLVICGGETMPPESLKLWQKSPMMAVRLLNAYGPTETTITALTFEIPQDIEWGAEQVPHSTNSLTKIPIGQPLKNRTVYILDDQKNLVPPGVAGELYIGGVGVARGYLNRSELTAAKFILNPFLKTTSDNDSRLYKTGDLVRYLPDGNIEFLGRIDNQVKIRGFRIELAEIEAVLNQHQSINETVVIPREDSPNDKRLVAYVVSTKEPLPTPEQLRQFLNQKLPNYMIPSAFVVLKAFPLTPNGKIDRRAFPKPEFLQSDETFTAPSAPIEEILTNIWSQVLNVNSISIHDNFFELGGHSLTATQIISRLRETFCLALPLKLLFEFPTIAQLAQQIFAATQKDIAQLIPCIEPRKQNELLPLSFAQQRLWFLNQLEGKSATYNISTVLSLKGKLNIDALQQALKSIVERHEILRTNFVMTDGTPTQVITPSLTLLLPLIDLEDIPEQTAQVKQFVKQETQHPFDFNQEFLWRATLVRLGQESHLLLLTIHHIIADGWSMSILLKELSFFYQSFNGGQTYYSLDNLSIQYADFALWQHQWFTSEVLQTQLDYWKQQLAGLPPVLELPTDHPRPAVQTFSGSSYSFVLSENLSKGLKTLSQKSGATLFMTILAAFAVVLSRYTHQEDFGIGSPIANRNRKEIEPLIGFFVNTLVMRIDLTENPSFSQLLGRVRKMALDAYAHQDLPFEKLVEELQPERSLSHHPLIQVMFALQNTPVQQLELEELTITEQEIESITAKFDLTLLMRETPQGLQGRWEYNTDLFEATTITRLTRHLQTLLEGIVANPEQPLSAYHLLTKIEYHQLLIEWNQTGTNYPLDQCIHHLFEEQVERTPEQVAVIFEEIKLTYNQLNQKANQLAHYLQKTGVKPDNLVGICLERSVEMIVGILAILKAGGAYVPLDPNYPPQRLAYMLEDAQVRVLLTQEKLVAKLPPNQAQVVCLDRDWHLIRNHKTYNPQTQISSSNLAYSIYTSGSTGKPKGVLLAHQGLCNLALFVQQTFDVKPQARILQFASISFDASVWEIFMALGSGATLCLATSDSLLPGTHLTTLLRNQNITHVTLPPSALEVMNPAELTSLKTLIVAGEACSQQIMEKWGKNRLLFNAYGPTETTVCATVSKWENHQKISIGRPINNTQIYILDKYLQPVPVGVRGEIYLAGVGLARGYLNQPQLTLSKFIANPFSNTPGAKLYKTGDLGRYLPDGNIEFLGRIDDQIKIRGFRIELEEVQSTLNQHPSVKQAIVTVRKDGMDDKHLVAYIVPEQQHAPTINELRHCLKEKLPDYMIPSAFVFLDTLFLTPNGKIDRRSLPAPDYLKFRGEKTFVAPRTPIEQQIADIWISILKLEKVSIHDNFFEVGGHSLLAVRLLYLFEKQLNKHLSLGFLFQHPTIADLAEALGQNTEILSKKFLVPIQPHGSKPPLFAIHTHLHDYQNLVPYLGQEQPIYGLADSTIVEQAISSQTSIEILAANYIQEMLLVQPKGPYYLIGASLGGLIAFEMAQQLVKAGKTVAFLGLLDASAPGFIKDLSFQERLISHWQELLELGWVNYLHKKIQSRTFKIRKYFKKLKFNYKINSKKLQSSKFSFSRKNEAIFAVNRQLKKSYIPQPYSGRITLFRATRTLEEINGLFRYLDQEMGWTKLALGGLDIYDVAGSHVNIIQEPYVKEVAAQLSHKLTF